jgi:hypothetical protein
MNKRLIVMLGCMILVQFAKAQTKADSVIIHVGEASKVIFAIGNKKDLETLKQYDFQAVVNDLIAKLEKNDTSRLAKPAETYVQPAVTTTEPAKEKEEDWDSSWRDRDRNDRYVDRDRNVERDQRGVVRERRYYGRRTYHSFNFDLGTNNYLTDNKFPDQNNDLYTVRPWGSWYVGLNSTQRTRLARKFFVEWGLGVSWYNFKFQDESVLMGKDPGGVTFTTDLRDLDFKKSKLTATYLNGSFVPMLDFGGNRRKSMFFDGDHSESFRIGAGPYVGYRIDSYSKQTYKDDGDKKEDRDRDNFYLNNIRYGLRVQLGFRDTDLFFNYDMNELFAATKGPSLNAFSFGITF